jgi:hypothetical protein
MYELVYERGEIAVDELINLVRGLVPPGRAVRVYRDKIEYARQRRQRDERTYSPWLQRDADLELQVHFGQNRLLEVSLRKLYQQGRITVEYRDGKRWAIYNPNYTTPLRDRAFLSARSKKGADSMDTDARTRRGYKSWETRRRKAT